VSQELNDSKIFLNFGTLSQNYILNEELSVQIFPPSETLQVPSCKLLSKLSYSHFIELLKVADPLKRTFYELECIKGTWSVRELKRQINSLYYERCGLSAKPELLSQNTQAQTTPMNARDIIKNVYAFEILDLPTRDILEETDFKKALLDNVQSFMIELGHGYCLEA
jgi:predicted nuclease of restriction endonuclease-like (RecB) superfamily